MEINGHGGILPVFGGRQMFVDDVDVEQLIPPIPQYIKQWYDVCAGDSASAPHTSNFIVFYNSLDIEHPQNGDTFYVQWFENSNGLTFSSTSGHVTVRSSMAGIVLNGSGGYSWSSQTPWQNLYTTFPAQMYNRGQVIPASNYPIKLNDELVSKEYDWS